MECAARHGWARAGAALAALLAGALAGIGPVAAEPSTEDKAMATALFREARALMAQGKVPDACLKFEESHRLDPSGGTILNLALCHEQEGKLARSWSEFNEAVAFARRDYRADRESEAREHASKLEPRLSKLTVTVPDDLQRLDGLRIERDGRELSRATWSLAIPVDGGAHVVRATAPGRKPFTATVDLPAESGAATVEIPALALAPPPPPAPPPPAAAASLIASPPPSPPDYKLRRKVSWIVGAAGVAQLAVGGTFGLRAIELDNKNDNIDGAAGRSADTATIFLLTGAVTTAAAGYLFLTSRAP
jgi:tetratricopeptide (TPR) repeat protein